MERSFARSLQSLNDVFAFVDERLESISLSNSDGMTARLVIEEIFTNMVRHNSHGSDEIRVGIELDRDTLSIVLVDQDSDRFDPREHSPVDVSAPLAERSAGGLGIHLVKHLVDEIRYTYRDRTSTVTLLKNIGNRPC